MSGKGKLSAMPNDPFYQSKDWVKLRSKVKTKWLRGGRPCAHCNKPIDPFSRPIVDHIIPKSERPDLALDESNLQLLHFSCHNVKTHRHERLELKQIGLDGLPEDGEWG